MAVTIQATDRIATVIARDERLIEILASAAPAFSRLRSPMMRRTMARLVTVEQAARMAGVDADELVALLNRSLEEGELPTAGQDERDAVARQPGVNAGTHPCGSDIVVRETDNRCDSRVQAPHARDAVSVATDGEPGEDPDKNRGKEDSMPPSRGNATGHAVDPMPAVLKSIPSERVVDADVREDLRRGEEPFRKIMDARKTVPVGGALRVRAIFEPIPLYAVMARQGLAHWTEKLAEDDWRVWFYAEDEAGEDTGSARPAESAATGFEAQPAEQGPSQPEVTPGARPSPEGDDAAAEAGDDVVVLDVRGMEPPEPMVHTLAALERLPAGGTLVQINVRVPQFLLPELEARGFSYEIREQEPGLVRVFIRRSAESA